MPFGVHGWRYESDSFIKPIQFYPTEYKPGDKFKVNV